MTIIRFDQIYLDTLCAQADASPRLRQHRNVHTDYADPCQRLFNAITTRSYLVPHRHALSPRDETMLAVRGRLALVVFDETGEVVEVVPFGAQGGDRQGRAVREGRAGILRRCRDEGPRRRSGPRPPRSGRRPPRRPVDYGPPGIRPARSRSWR